MQRRSQTKAGIDANDGPPASKRFKAEHEEHVPARPSANNSLRPEFDMLSFPSDSAKDVLNPRCEKLWLRDGNVILVAETLAFKVHASVLERHSVVFGELLAEEDPARGHTETHDNCRVLRTSDWGPELAQLLHIMYDGGTVTFFDRAKPIPFAELRAITLLAVKYKVTHVVAHAVSRLEAAFPIKFDPTRFTDLDYVDGGSGKYSVICKEEDCIGAAALARAIDPARPPSFIASALYYCCQLPTARFFNPVQYGREAAFLPSADIQVCASAYQWLLKADRTVRMPLLYMFEQPLCNDNICTSGVRHMVKKWLLVGRWAGHEALRTSDDWFVEHAEKHPEKRLCASCEAHVKASIDGERAKAFQALGKVFGLQGWRPAQ
ncbi:hypothetical protein PsYK624_157920 [Phanerochaete sordida]|uniref:BTB domain-containing protein n=1 Tax=Phanerochaete sordida TaxID=48140 RepID=A0A9P3GRJ3_9APHY|nr:hypothetical protein PsYK624_157920 [Phanerochaete sordida]